MNKKLIKKAITSFLCCTLLPSAYTAEKEDTKDKELLTLSGETFFVTATRTKRAESTLPANVTVITKEDLAKSTAQTLPDVFKHLAGVDVREDYGDFSNTAVDVRGFGEVAAANTLIMVDGRRMNRIDTAGVNYSSVPLNRVERVEVYRGGRSVLYGNNAVGGVINIITKKDRPEGHTLTLQSEFGSYDSYKMSAFLDGQVGKTSYTLDSTYFDTKGYRTNNYERMKNAGFSVMIQENEDWDIFISGNVSEFRVGTPSNPPAGGNRRDASNTIGYFEAEEQTIYASPRYWINDDVNIELSTSYREGNSLLISSSGSESTNDYYDYGFSPKILIDSYSGDIKNTTIAGVDYNYGKINHSASFIGKNNMTNYGFYLYNTTSFLDDKFFLDLGYRRERYEIDANGDDLSPEDLDAASAGLTYQYAKNSKVFISYDKSFRYQRVEELGGASFNEALAPQKSRTLQAGLAHQINDQWKFSLTYFNIETDNEIFYNPDLGFGQNMSYGETEREGYELELNYQPTEELNLFLNYTKIDAELGKDSPTSDANKGNDIPRVPQETLNAGYSWDFMPHFNWTTSGKWADRQFVQSDYGNSFGQDDGYIVVDTKLTFTWDWFSIYAGCNNLFDEKYNSNAYRNYFNNTIELPAPGRNFFGGMSMTFDF